MMLKSIFKSAVFCMAAAVSFTACEVDTTTVMFEEDHNFDQPGDTVFSMLGILNKVQNVAERGILLGEVRCSVLLSLKIWTTPLLTSIVIIMRL